jgi:hypothetical protein
MYGVISYFNYRKDVSFNILKTFKELKNAEEYALQMAEEEYGEENVVEGVNEEWVYINSEILGYTKGDGYSKWVYTVIYIPDPDN